MNGLLKNIHESGKCMNRPVAAIDIGTNSFHMIIARADESGHIEILDREKVSVRLGSGGDDFDLILPDAQDRAVSVLKGFVQIARQHNALIHAVGTSAVREARNQDEFLKRVRRECGIRIHVIPGQEEARLIYIGILQALPVFDKKILMIDIGGGSTEYLIGRRGIPEFIQSLKMGAIRMTERYFPGGRVEPDAIDSCRTFIRYRLESMLELTRDRGESFSYDLVAGSSGTIKTVLDLTQRHLPDPNRQADTFTARDLDRIVDLLLSARTTEERIRKTGLDEKRADIITGGVLVLHESFRILNIDRMVYSPYALREGVLYEVLFRKKKRENLNEIRRTSVQFLARKFLGRNHSEDTARISLLLLHALNRAHLAHLVDQDLLEYGALLHNIGMAIGHAGHHKHGMYIIQNTDILLGFSTREIAFLAALARYHRKSLPSKNHPEFMALAEEDRSRLKLFAGILRVAIGLSRARQGVIREIVTERTDLRSLQLIVRLSKNPFRSTPDLSYALTSAEIRKELLEEALKLKIKIKIED
jgi:exopolyphosphatase/guanosine-5'-triphosphate,3'-diphosphate pyrophosphatase